MKKIIVPILLMLVLASCSREKGDKPIARGEGDGHSWKSDVSGDFVRYSVKNTFPLTSYLALDRAGVHYELEIRPVRDAFIVVPAAWYDISARTDGISLGESKYEVSQDDQISSKGYLVRIITNEEYAAEVEKHIKKK